VKLSLIVETNGQTETICPKIDKNKQIVDK
jgi:hypothetical protein